MVRFSLTAPLLMVSLALGLASTEARALPRRVDLENRSISSPLNKIDPREIDQAIELLRRANYDFAEHVHNDLEKRGQSEEKWTMYGGGYTCHCSGKGQSSNVTPAGQHIGGGQSGSNTGNNGSGSWGSSSSGGGSSGGNSSGGNSGKGGSGNGGSGSHTGGGSNGGGGGGGGGGHSNPPGGGGGHSNPPGGGGSNPPSGGGNGKCPSGYQPARQGDIIQINDNDLIDLSGLTVDLNILNFGKDGKQSGQQTVPITDKPQCKDDTCCYKPNGNCPDGYQYVSKGNVYQYNDNDLLDLSGLTVNLDILNFFKNADKTSESKPASDKPSCQSDACCIKPIGSTEPGKCPSGYTKAGQGDVIQINDNDLIDASGADIILNLLNFGSNGQETGGSKVPAKNKPKCDAEVCCYKPLPGNGNVCPSGTVPVNQGSIIQENDNDLLDLSNLSLDLNILNFGSNGKQIGQSTASPKDKTTCNSAVCCVSAGGNGSGNHGNPHTCPSGYASVSQGNIIQKSDNDLLDLSDLSVVLNILNFGSDGKQSGSENAKGSDSTKCTSSYCCVKPSGGSDNGNHHNTCPSGYAPVSQGNIIQKSDNDLLDLSDLSVVLNILNFGSDGKQSGSESAKGSDSTKCTSSYCCVKPNGGNNNGNNGGDNHHSCPSGFATIKQGDIIQKSDNDLLDLSNLSISLNILNFGSDGKQSGSEQASAGDSTKCTSSYCCVQPNGSNKGNGNNSGSNPSDHHTSKTCPSGYQTAHQGDVMQVSDNDGIDLKNLKIDIHILDFSKPEKTVAASSKPTCEDETCCYKASSVKQVSDNDLVDGKNGKVSVCILSSDCD